MRIRKHLRIIIFLISFIGALMFYYSNYSFRQSIKLSRIFEIYGILSKNVYDSNFIAGYAIWSPYCKMLQPNPWNESIQKYLIEPPPLICSRLPRLTYVEQLNNSSYVLKISKRALKKYNVGANHIVRCCYSVITRITQSVQNYNSRADRLYKLTNCAEFKDQVLLSNDTEFLMVNCRSCQKGKKKGKIVYKDVHPIIQILPEVNLKINKFLEQKKHETEIDMTKQNKSVSQKLNIIVLGIDSISKLNLRRIMPKTLKYLQESNWVELNGYNKIGENTFPNLMAILSGRSMQDLEKICWGNHSQKIDDCPIIWKEYNKNGYITLYAEDTPSISTFNLLRTGFVEKPTDYYLRPFMLAAHDLLHLKILNGLPVCVGPVLIIDHILNYAKKFFHVFHNYSYFSLLWLNSLSHNDLNAPRALDINIYRFLNELSNIGTYDNSLILLLSDHGVRFGDIRETFLGYLEERLPFMFIWCPSWFREKYPDKYNNLLINQNRLTSPYDVYVTIKKLLIEENEKKETAISFTKQISSACPKCNGLLEVQPKDRTCTDASIDVNWCLCSEFRNVPIHEEISAKIGRYFYNYIVNQTKNLIKTEKIKKSLCSKWKFLKIFRTQEIVLPKTLHQYSLRNLSNVEIKRHENQTLNSNTKIYVTIIELNPGKTKFESTIQMTINSSVESPIFAFLEPPKRLDSIYKTSKCVKNPLLKNYCYCV